MQGLQHAFLAALRVASRPFTLAMERIGRLLDFVLDFIVDFKGDVTWAKMLILSAVAAGLALGVGSAVIFIRGDDDAPLATAPTATVAAGLTPAPTTGIATPAATAASTVVGATIITLRGEIDDASMGKVGLSVYEHSVELIIFRDTGVVTGSMVISLDAFPIGKILAGTFDAQEGDPAWAQFRDCTVRLNLAGVVTGTYDPASGALLGETRVTPVTEDVHNCVATRPPNVTLDATTETSTFTWSASFDGRTANGMTQLEPPTPFTAVVVE